MDLPHLPEHQRDDWREAAVTHAVPCGCEAGRCTGLALNFEKFNGRVILESTWRRRCIKCRRFIGRCAKSYGYGSRSLDVCQRCHRRNWRRYERDRRTRETIGGKR